MALYSGHRAFLFVPGDRPDRFSKAAKSGANAVILDLEDAVGKNSKADARAALSASFTDVPVIVRINAFETQWYEKDLARVQEIKPSAVMLPKSKDPETVKTVISSLGDRIPVIALIECAIGLSNSRSIAALNGVNRLAFGSIDFCVDLGCAHIGDALLLARTELVQASRQSGIEPPIDGVTTDMTNPELTFNDAFYAHQLGFGGKLCIHPMQVAAVKRAFAPSEDDIKWARKVVASGNAATNVDGAMVDQPVRIRAQNILSVIEDR